LNATVVTCRAMRGRVKSVIVDVAVSRSIQTPTAAQLHKGARFAAGLANKINQQ